MATRTITNGGGNYSSTSTWVEGAVPTSNDQVVATGTSGNLTVDVASVANTVILTGYVGKLTMNATLTLSNTSGSAPGLTLASGMTMAGTSDIIVGGTSGTVTINSVGITLTGGLQLTASGTASYALSANIAMVGTLTLNTIRAMSGSFVITVGGGLTVSAVVGVFAPSITLNGTGTWSGANNVNINLTINTAGTITISGTVIFGNTHTLTWTSGTVITTSSTLQTTGAITFDTSSGITWNIIRFLVGTMTLNSTLNATTIVLGGNMVFAGTAGFSCGNLYAQAFTVTLHSTNTYTVSTFLQIAGNPGTLVVWSASTGSSAALFQLGYGAQQMVIYVSATDINSNGGQTMGDYQGTLLRTTNWSTGIVGGTLTRGATFGG